MPVPALAALAPLLPLLGQMIPTIASWFGGKDAEETAVVVQAAVRAVAGTTDPAQVATTLADPQKHAEMVSELARIAADREAARDRAIVETLKTQLADVADARAMARDFAAKGSHLAYGPAILTGALLILFAYALMEVLGGRIAAENTRIADMLLGALLSWVGAGVAFWLGTTRGAQVMRDALMGKQP